MIPPIREIEEYFAVDAEARNASLAHTGNAVKTGAVCRGAARLLVLKAGGGDQALAITHGVLPIGYVSEVPLVAPLSEFEIDMYRARLGALVAG